MYTQLNTRCRARRPSTRRGAVTVLAAILSILILAMVAFSVDVGYVLSVKEELQRTADATALAACWEYAKNVADGTDQQMSEQTARVIAQQFASANDVGNQSPEINPNPSNSSSGDLAFGYISDLYDPSPSFDTAAVNSYNAVKVRVRRDTSLNGEATLFFARIFGLSGQALQAEATAVLVRDVKGFRAPHDDSNVDILPFALDEETWNDWMAGGGVDQWSWNESSESVATGGDGFREVNLYQQGTNLSANRGTVDIGSNPNTSDVAQQIVNGVSPEDFALHGGSLEFDQCGELNLNGDSGISAGLQSELIGVVGEPRVIAVFKEVSSLGDSATYTIVRWMGVRIMDANVEGPMSQRRVTIQAAPVVGPGVIPSIETGTSAYVYAPAILLE